MKKVFIKGDRFYNRILQEEVVVVEAPYLNVKEPSSSEKGYNILETNSYDLTYARNFSIKDISDRISHNIECGAWIALT